MWFDGNPGRLTSINTQKKTVDIRVSTVRVAGRWVGLMRQIHKCRVCVSVIMRGKDKRMRRRRSREREIER